MNFNLHIFTYVLFLMGLYIYISFVDECASFTDCFCIELGLIYYLYFLPFLSLLIAAFIYESFSLDFPEFYFLTY